MGHAFLRLLPTKGTAHWQSGMLPIIQLLGRPWSIGHVGPFPALLLSVSHRPFNRLLLQPLRIL